MLQSSVDFVRVAACQLGLRIGETAHNRAAARDAIGIAAGQGARVVVLPELAASGYVFSGAAEARSLRSTAEARRPGYFFLARVSPSPIGSSTSSTRSSATA
jgi:predicted amidohydrolase